MLDDHHRLLGAARNGVVHAEHDDALVDDRELQRQFADDSRLLTHLDETPDAGDGVGILEHGVLVEAARVDLRRHFEPDVLLLRRRRVRRLREDEDLLFDPCQHLVEAFVDRPPVAEHLDVLE